jgi:hypothetical protein
MTNREIKTIIQPNFGEKKGFKIVVEIQIDRNGKVIKAMSGVRGSTTLDWEIMKLAEEVALKTIFNSSEIAPEIQRGTITYWVIND